MTNFIHSSINIKILYSYFDEKTISCYNAYRMLFMFIVFVNAIHFMKYKQNTKNDVTHNQLQTENSNELELVCDNNFCKLSREFPCPSH